MPRLGQAAAIAGCRSASFANLRVQVCWRLHSPAIVGAQRAVPLRDAVKDAIASSGFGPRVSEHDVQTVGRGLPVDRECVDTAPRLSGGRSQHAGATHPRTSAPAAGGSRANEAPAASQNWAANSEPDSRCVSTSMIATRRLPWMASAMSYCVRSDEHIPLTAEGPSVVLGNREPLTWELLAWPTRT